MLSLTNLDASGSGVRSLDGLETAHNLTALDLSKTSSLPGASQRAQQSDCAFPQEQSTERLLVSDGAQQFDHTRPLFQFKSPISPFPKPRQVEDTIRYRQSAKQFIVLKGLTNLNSLNLSYVEVTEFSLLNGSAI